MNDINKEQLLHKVIASSAFLCALCILPVAQYFLNSNTPSHSERGQVAGVSTDTITQASVPLSDSAACQTKRTTDLADLQRYETGTKIAILSTYEETIAPYESAAKGLRGTPESITSEKEALNRLIDGEYQPYLKKLSAVDSAVLSQKKEIESRSCPVE